MNTFFLKSIAVNILVLSLGVVIGTQVSPIFVDKDFDSDGVPRLADNRYPRVKGKDMSKADFIALYCKEKMYNNTCRMVNIANTDSKWSRWGS